jgi:hypothetical protein
LIGFALDLDLYLPTNYPEDKPTLKVRGSGYKVEHHLVSDGVIVHARLTNWNVNSSLAALIEHIMTEFSLSPPRLIEVSSFKPPEPVQREQNFKGLELKSYIYC